MCYVAYIERRAGMEKNSKHVDPSLINAAGTNLIAADIRTDQTVCQPRIMLEYGTILSRRDPVGV